MKRIASLTDPTPGLAAYLAEEVDEVKDWEGFRSHETGASYLALVETLMGIQHGLYGYCEIDIDVRFRQDGWIRADDVTEARLGDVLG